MEPGGGGSRCCTCSVLRLLAGASYLCLWLKLEDEYAWLRCLRWSSLHLSAGHSYLCLWLRGCCAVCAGARYVCRQEPRTFNSGLEMNGAALSALQLATMSAGAAYICLCFKDGCFLRSLRCSSLCLKRCACQRISRHSAFKRCACQRVSRHSAVYIGMIFSNAYNHIYLYSWIYVHVHQKDIYIYMIPLDWSFI